MSKRSRAAAVTASALILWALPAVATLATTVHALHHEHDLDHRAEDHWQSMSDWLSHGHEHAVDTPEHEHMAVSPAVAGLPLPRRDSARLAAADVDPGPISALLAPALAGSESVWGWRSPPARPSPGTARHQILSVLLL